MYSFNLKRRIDHQMYEIEKKGICEINIINFLVVVRKSHIQVWFWTAGSKANVARKDQAEGASSQG
jgi:hypothetical protein